MMRSRSISCLVSPSFQLREFFEKRQLRSLSVTIMPFAGK